MVFLVFFVFGIVLAFGTTASMRKKLDYGFYGDNWCYSLHVSEIPRDSQLTLHLFMSLSIVFLGGTSIAILWELMEFYYWPIPSQIVVGILLVILSYGILYFALSLKQFDEQPSHLLFILILIASAFLCTVLVNSYNQNVETITDTVVEQTVKRELLYFCNAPVQKNVSGEFKADSSILTSSTIPNSDTVHEVTYWYVDEHGGGTFGTSPTDYSRIEFLEDGEIPYVEIFYYYKYTKKVDTNIDRVWTTEETRWNGYVYHLPKSVLEMPLK